jgi:hypothetical protein
MHRRIINDVRAAAYRKVKQEYIVILKEFVQHHYSHQDDSDIINFDGKYHNQKHNPTGLTIGCGCAYCNALHKYRNFKVLTHRAKRRFENEFEFISSDLLQTTENQIAEMSKIVDELRMKKNKYAEKLGIVKHIWRGVLY